jgi:hypothetical protein
VVAALVLVVAACGGSGDDGADDGATDTTAVRDDGGGSTDTTAPVTDDGGTDGGDTPDTTPPAPQAPEVTELGSFTVNETEFAVTFLNRCIPFDGPDSDVIDLQPIAQGQGAQLNLYGTSESIEVSVQGGTIRQMFGSIAFGASNFDDVDIEWSIDGDRWTGSATLNDALDEVDPVSVAWDVMIPDEVVDCSL